jgi:hypothetical protein
MEKNTKQPLDNLHMIDGLGDETKITSFDMFCQYRDDDLVKKMCPSLFKWANYLLEPYEDIENKDKSKLKTDNYQSVPMQSYNITDDAKKWKSEIPSETTPSADSTSIINMEELIKFDFDVENSKNPPLINNIAEALEVCHSKYEKLKKKNNQQKDEHDMVQVGIALIIQTHCNDTGTQNNHGWKKTLGMIRARHLEFLKNAGGEEKETEKEKEISENEPVQAIHSQDIATESKMTPKILMTTTMMTLILQ